MRDASLSILTDTGTHTLDRIDVTASADSAVGPIKADGFVRRDQRLVPFRIATGAIANGRLAIKAESDPLAGLPRGEANGTLLWNGGAPRFEGPVTLSGEVTGAAKAGGATPWRARLDGSASFDAADIKAVELRLGDDSAKIVATGSGQITRDGGVVFDLQSERPDFDRFRAAYDLRATRAAFVASGWDGRYGCAGTRMRRCLAAKSSLARVPRCPVRLA